MASVCTTSDPITTSIAPVLDGTKRDPAVYIGPAMFNNCGNLGLPLAILAFGEDALPLAVVLLVTENLLQFTVGLWLLGDSIHIKRLATNPMLVATFAGVLGMVMDWHAPAMIEPGIRMLGEISIPLMLVALGVRLADGAPGQWAAGFWGGLLCPLTGLIVAVPWVLITQPAPPLAALLLVFGALPPAADPSAPTEAETAAIQDRLDLYQAVFDTH